MIEFEVMPLLGSIKADGSYTSYQRDFNQLCDYIKSWFEEPNHEMKEYGSSHNTDDSVNELG